MNTEITGDFLHGVVPRRIRVRHRQDLSTAMVSKHIAALESHLGVRLLDRNTRKTMATEAGRQYFDRCISVLAALDEAESELMDVSGVLR